MLHLLALSLPLLAVVILYVVCDPFKVLRHYDTYYSESQAGGGVSLNPGFVACEVWRQQHGQEHYDAYVFGNSRSIYFRLDDWLQILPEGASAMHFDAAAETLYGLERKLDFIDRNGGELRHALFVVDAGLLQATESNDESHLCILAPQLASWVGWLQFHWVNLRTFLTPKFLCAYLDYSLTGQLRSYMTRESLLNDDMFAYDARRNEMDFFIMEQMIDEGSYYDDRRCAVFEGVQFPDSVSPVAIGPEQTQLLDHIARILERHHASATWIISPLYNQIRINPADVATLRQFFGASNVFDFSGPNQWNADYHNYYEASHYRPHVAAEILRQIK